MGQAVAILINTISLISELNSAIQSNLTKKGTRIDKKIEAVRSLQKAINNTRNYLIKSNNDYQPNVELSNLWNEAFAAMLPIDNSLAMRLNFKSRFWSDPNNWLEYKSAMELVPGLKELEEDCDSIILELNKRKG